MRDNHILISNKDCTVIVPVHMLATVRTGGHVTGSVYVRVGRVRPWECDVS